MEAMSRCHLNFGSDPDDEEQLSRQVAQSNNPRVYDLEDFIDAADPANVTLGDFERVTGRAGLP